MMWYALVEAHVAACCHRSVRKTTAFRRNVKSSRATRMTRTGPKHLRTCRSVRCESKSTITGNTTRECNVLLQQSDGQRWSRSPVRRTQRPQRPQRGRKCSTLVCEAGCESHPNNAFSLFLQFERRVADIAELATRSCFCGLHPLPSLAGWTRCVQE